MNEFLAVVFWLAGMYVVCTYGAVFAFALMATDNARAGLDPASSAAALWRALPWAPVSVPLWIIAQRRAVMREEEDDG